VNMWQMETKMVFVTAVRNGDIDAIWIWSGHGDIGSWTSVESRGTGSNPNLMDCVNVTCLTLLRRAVTMVTRDGAYAS
jgi:hypothetical protein